MSTHLLSLGAGLLLVAASPLAAQGAPVAVTHDPVTGTTELLDAPNARVASLPGSLTSPALPGGAYAGVGNFGSQDAEHEDWSPNCKVISIFADGSSLVSSGSFVDPLHVIVSGAAVHQGPGGDWATSVVVAPAWDGDVDFASNAVSEHFTSWTGWTINGDESFNQGLVRIADPIGFLSGWYGLGAVDDEAETLATPFLFGAYPLGCVDGAPDQLNAFLGLWDTFDGADLTAATSWACPYDGIEGAGAFVAPPGGGFEVRAVMNGGTFDGVTTTELTAARITEQMFAYYATYVDAPYSPTEIELLPLKIRADADVVTAFDPLGITFDIANVSLVDPAQFTLSYQVVLSEDEVVSPDDATIASGTFSHDFGPKSSVTVPLSILTSPLIEPGEYHVGVRITTFSDEFVSYGWHQDTLKVVTDDPYEDLGGALAGALGNPILTHTGDLTLGSSNSIGLLNAPPSTVASLFFSLTQSAVPFKGGVIQAFGAPPIILLTTPTNPLGQITLPFVFADEAPFGVDLYFQWVIADGTGPLGFTISNAVRGFTQ